MALSLTPSSSSCLYTRTSAASRPRRADRPGCLHTGKGNLFHSEVRKNTSWRSNGRATQAQVTMMATAVPRVVYRDPANDTSDFMDLYEALQKDQILFIADRINEEKGNNLLATLLYLDGLDLTQDLYFFINCLGGDVSPSLAVYDTMRSLRRSVITRCIGYAYDISGFILAAGKKGLRSALPRSKIILRSPVGEATGKADDLLNEAKELVKIRDHLYNHLAEHTGQSVEKIFDDLIDSKRFSAKQAIEYGLIDRIPEVARITVGKQKKTAPGLG